MRKLLRIRLLHSLLLLLFVFNNFALGVGESEVVEVSARFGRNVTLQCPLKIEGNLQIAWIKADSRAILSLHGERVTQSGRYHSARGRGSRLLTIYGVRESDEGDYICQLNSEPMKNIRIHVWVKKPPSLHLTSSQGSISNRATVRAGASLNVSCEASGIPLPVVEWKRRKPNNNVVVLGRGKGERTLSLTEISADDAAEYMCVAQNGEPPPRSQAFRLIVIELNGDIVDPWAIATTTTTTAPSTSSERKVKFERKNKPHWDEDQGSAWWRGRAGNRYTSIPSNNDISSMITAKPETNNEFDNPSSASHIKNSICFLKFVIFAFLALM